MCPYLFTRTGLCKDALTDYRDRQDATNRFLVAAIVLNSDSVLSSLRREVRRVTDILVEKETIQKVLREQVIKRDTLEGDQAQASARSPPVITDYRPPLRFAPGEIEQLIDPSRECPRDWLVPALDERSEGSIEEEVLVTPFLGIRAIPERPQDPVHRPCHACSNLAVVGSVLEVEVRLNWRPLAPLHCAQEQGT